MTKITLHNHSSFSFDSKSNIEDMVEFAIKNNFKYIGFSEHQDFDSNLNEYLYMDYNRFSEKLSLLQDDSRIKILKAIELDYQYRFEETIRDYIADKIFNYKIGSIHYLNAHAVDLPSFVDYAKEVGYDKIAKQYFEEILHLVKSGLFEIVGHIDLVKLYTDKIDIDLHRDKLLEIFDIMKEKNIILEINYAGLRKQIKETYPSIDILQLYYNNGNRLITVSADAHEPNHLEFNPDLSFIKEIGFKALYIPIDNEIIEIAI